jgi:hypothetical protein
MSSNSSSAADFSIGSNANLLSRATGLSVALTLRNIQSGTLSPADLALVVGPIRREEALRRGVDAANWRVTTIPGEPDSALVPFPPVPERTKAPTAAVLLNMVFSNLSNAPGRFLKHLTPFIDANTKNPYYISLDFTTSGPRRATLEKLQKLRDMDEYRRALEYASKRLYSNGTMIGMIQRMIDGSKMVDRQKDLRSWERPFLDDITARKLFPIKEDTPVLNYMTDVLYKFNLKADYGIPMISHGVSLKKGKFVEQIVVEAAHIFASFAKGTHREYFGKNPHIMTAILKNKASVYEIDLLHTKIRPYYVFNAPLAVVYSTLMKHLTESIKNATDDIESAYMPGFSWAHGGAEKLSDIIRGAGKWKDVSSKILIYSDDHQIIFTASNGERKIFIGDVSAMDMSLTKDDITGLYNSVMAVHKDTISEAWRKVLLFQTTHALETPVLFPHSILLQLSLFLKSGIPGTTLYGCHYMAPCCIRLRSYLQSPEFLTDYSEKSPTQINKAYEFIYKVYKSFGMKCKNFVIRDAFSRWEDTDEYYTEQIVILGQELVWARPDPSLPGYWYPQPKLENLITSYIHAPQKPPDVPSYIFNAARIIGLVVSGAWCYPKLYEWMKKDFEEILNGTFGELDIDRIGKEVEVLGGESLEDPRDELLSMFKHGFPPADLVRKIYTEKGKVEIPAEFASVHIPAPTAFSMASLGFSLPEHEEKGALPVQVPTVPTQSEVDQPVANFIPLDNQVILGTIPIPKFPADLPPTNTPARPDTRQNSINRKAKRRAAEEKKQEDRVVGVQNTSAMSLQPKSKKKQRKGDYFIDIMGDSVEMESDNDHEAERIQLQQEHEQEAEMLAEQELRRERSERENHGNQSGGSRTTLVAIRKVVRPPPR